MIVSSPRYKTHTFCDCGVFRLDGAHSPRDSIHRFRRRRGNTQTRPASIQSLFDLANGKIRPTSSRSWGEQHAIGERMIREGPRGVQSIGYACFLVYMKSDPDPLICALENDVKSLGTCFERAFPRLTELQHSLIDLVVFLDPEEVRFPHKNRTKIVLKSSA